MKDSSNLAYGFHAIENLLNEPGVSIDRLLVQKDRTDERLERILVVARARKIPIERVSRKHLDLNVKQIEGAVHQGLIAHTEAVYLASEKEFEFRWPSFGVRPLVLILDGVMDPRNLGACLRTAGAAGVDAVLLPKRRCAPLTAVARKSASGAAESLFLVSVTNLARRLRWLSEQHVYLVGSSGDTETAEKSARWNQADYTQATALIVGGEQRGMRALTAKHCDEVVCIPMHGRVESLNVSVAAGILLFEAVRQRGCVS